MAQPALLETRAVTKRFHRRDGTVLTAVQSVNVTIGAAETVALVGETGSGKSTLARLALGLEVPDEGQILFRGRTLDQMSSAEHHKFRLAVQPIFQDPGASFNPRRRVRELLRQAFIQAGKPGSAIPPATAAVLASVGIPATADFLQRYPHELSGGQRQRLAIARALAMAPDLLIADEPLSGADASIRGQILNLLSDLQDQRGIAILFITHDISIARAFAHRVAVMYQGNVVEQGLAGDVLGHPQHPYTQLLLAAAPSVGGLVDFSRFSSVPHRKPADGGCIFYSRCPIAMDSCTEIQPALTPVGPDGHRAACLAVESVDEAPLNAAVN
ncbi:MAG: ABC transporter ATP-binding protein [Candidatus Dormibacteraeota bacterium]|nr:ABC transporter ATP-binding protein [Candidatus Dormibacteraeota bacterium]